MNKPKEIIETPYETIAYITKTAATSYSPAPIKGEIIMRCVRSFIIGLFDNFAVGSVHTINTDTQMITGAFVGFVDGVVLLSNATVRSATTGAVLAVGVPIIRIPIGRINYVI